MPKAYDSYDATTCSTVCGVHLFKHTDLDMNDPATKQPLQFYFGNGVWTDCPNGIPDVLAMSAQNSRDAGRGELSCLDIQDDWGLISNQKDEITHRAFLNGRIVSVQYLGHINGELATQPATYKTVRSGLSPATAPVRAAGQKKLNEILPLLRDNPDLSDCLRRIVSEATALSAVGGRTVQPYAKSILALAERAYEFTRPNATNDIGQQPTKGLTNRASNHRP